MKKTILLALALVVSASFSPVEAIKKKNREVVFPAQPVKLNNSSDSLSYAAGVALTNGLILREGLRNADNPKQKAYMVGLDIARQINERMVPGITEEFKDSPDSIVAPLLHKGFIAALEGDTTIFTYDVAEKFFSQKRAADKLAKDERLYGPNREAGEKFLKENAKNDSVIVLPSGLQYKVLVKGDGEVPLENQTVQVNYEGRLIDGTVFDASSKHDTKPSEFKPTQVIKGWTEALTMMPVGSKWQLFIPYYLAYGEKSAGKIQPYSALIFDVELVGIVKK